MSRPKDPHGRGYKRLVGKVLRAEKGLRGYRPTVREGPPEPRGADEVLAALASRYRPGDAIGLQQVIDCIAVTWEHAQAVRKWAESVGAWPYVRPSPVRPPTRPDRKERAG
jgi:hypothetical protein